MARAFKPEQEQAISAVRLIQDSGEFIRASIAVDKAAPVFHAGTYVPTPAFFLAYHAAELALKAFLRHKEATLAELHKLRHNVPEALQRARSQGLDEIVAIDRATEVVLDILHGLNADVGLRYPPRGVRTFPRWSAVLRSVVSLFNPISRHVGLQRTFPLPEAKPYEMVGSVASDLAIEIYAGNNLPPQDMSAVGSRASLDWDSPYHGPLRLHYIKISLPDGLGSSWRFVEAILLEYGEI